MTLKQIIKKIDHEIELQNMTKEMWEEYITKIGEDSSGYWETRGKINECLSTIRMLEEFKKE